ncbi:hypothetical protein PXH66_22025 [Synoicihabitans lomoniglobus]|uniref:Glucodextranase-like C-terminal domain-containing protein n=1 Tax=Synoicihabitans lomoniglobus TaxID=2909285 RepID=A0AAE9ZX22_9BACT|nr:hypothetical protein PXH66_22025 [Opitutaceae bacterium LMO-M01]
MSIKPLCKIGATLLVCALFAMPATGARPEAASASNPSVASRAVFNLPRLAGGPTATDSLSPGQYRVINLAASGVGLPGVTRTERKEFGVEFLDLGPERSWSFRAGHGSSYYVFTLNASLGTEIDLPGLSLRLAASKHPGFGSLESSSDGRNWERLGFEIALVPFGNNRMMAGLRSLTVRLDRSSKEGAVFLGPGMLLAAQIPLGRVDHAKPVRVVAGEAGAWVYGALESGESPLFVDANGNDVPDTFEREVVGGLAAADSPAENRAILVKIWREVQLETPRHTRGNLVSRRPLSETNLNNLRQLQQSLANPQT